jgi:Protein of unknown function (DUF3352)
VPSSFFSRAHGIGAVRIKAEPQSAEYDLTMRALRLIALAFLVFTLFGCGADERTTTAAGAEVAPASVPAFVSIDSDLSSDQWRQMDELLKKFPARDELIAELSSAMKEDSGLDYEDDVKPALGDEVDLVWLDFENDGSNVVFLTKPKDEGAFQSLLEKLNSSSDDKLVCEETDGWFACSDAQATIDHFQAIPGNDKLADDELYNDALAELPDEALVHVYVRGESIVEALKGLAVPGSPLPLSADQRPEYLSAALAAEGDGFRLVGTGRAAQEPSSQTEAFESTLLKVVPDDAVAFLTFKSGDEYEAQLRELEKNDAYRMGVREFERMLGIPLSSLLELFENEVGLYVRPGSPIPEVTLLIEAPNEQAALARVDAAVTNLTKSVPAQPCHAPTEEAGVKVRCVGFSEFELRTAAFDGKVVVTIGQGAIAKLRNEGDKLADDDGFKDAREAADMPAESVGFMWLDLEDGIPMVLGLANASGGSIPAEIRGNLEPLGSFLAWADSDGRSGSFTAFLQID